MATNKRELLDAKNNKPQLKLPADNIFCNDGIDVETKLSNLGQLSDEFINLSDVVNANTNRLNDHEQRIIYMEQNKIRSITKYHTLFSDGWVNSDKGQYAWMQSIKDSIYKEEMPPPIEYLIQAGLSKEEVEAEKAEHCKITRILTHDGEIVTYCISEKPEISLKIMLEVFIP